MEGELYNFACFETEFLNLLFYCVMAISISSLDDELFLLYVAKFILMSIGYYFSK